jgi:rieske iron-sulfur protein
MRDEDVTNVRDDTASGDTGLGVCACRRQVLGAGAAAALLMMAGTARADEDDPTREARPKAGDLFVFFEGDHQGTVIKPADLKAGGPPTLAWPFDPQKKVPRDASRLNQVLLVRLDPATLDDKTKPHAAEGIVAYSAICTHAACTVSAWMPEKRWFLCPCHGSEYDPKQDAQAVFGPAPRRLAALPLKIAEGALTAAGSFIGHVGIGTA